MFQFAVNIPKQEIFWLLICTSFKLHFVWFCRSRIFLVKDEFNIAKYSPKSKAKMTKREDINNLSSMQGNEDAQNEYLDVSRMNKKKKRKEHNEENEKLVIEQEREMKKLENSLFGSLYSPVEFRKEDKEEIQDKLEKGSALFITDRSANSKLLFMKRMQNYEK